MGAVSGKTGTAPFLISLFYMLSAHVADRPKGLVAPGGLIVRVL